MREIRDSIEVHPVEAKGISDMLLRSRDHATDIGDNMVYDVFTCHLGDGFFVDIIVRVNMADDTWVDASLFDDGKEVAWLPPRSKLLGDYAFEYNGTRYIITVREGV